MKCPRDSAELLEVTLDKKICHQCPTCKGYFIGAVGSNLASVKPASEHCVETGEKPMSSPAANELMQRFIYEGIKLDFCKSTNSIWLDAGELEMIVKKAKADAERLQQKFATKQSFFTTDNSFWASAAASDTFGVLEFVGEAVSSLFD